MAPVRILHIIQQLSRGGASRAMLHLARYSGQTGKFTHRVVSLIPAAPKALALAREAGVAVLSQPDRTALFQAIEEAGIVQVNFWNTPELYAFLRAEKPAARMLVWAHVAGDKPPQVLTDELFGVADFLLACCQYTPGLPIFEQHRQVKHPLCDMVWASPDFERLSGLEPREHDHFNIGYLGTVDFGKMHPSYVAMSAAAKVPGARFIVCGAGNGLPVLKRQIEQAGAQERFELRGYVEDIRSFFETLDVFGYPLCAETYAGAEMVLQEAMYAGVPPVIFPNGGAQRTVIHGDTGLVVHSEAEYTAAIESLYQQPEECKRLGENARAFARREFGAEKSARAMNEVYRQMLELPKQRRPWPRGGFAGSGGAALFVESLGGAAPQFQTSLTAKDPESVLQAEALIRCSPPVLVSADGGGILHYRRFYPSDPHLRLWSGLVLLEQSRPALAAAEFSGAQKLGLAHWRVDWYQSQAVAKAGSPKLALALARKVLEAAPGFEPASRFLDGRLDDGMD